MIEEDYVSFETAKLLKEKGFDGDTNCYYIEGTESKNLCYSPIRNNHNKRITSNEFDINIDIASGRISAPTLQMAMEWLREVHKLHIAILWDCGAYIGKNSFCYHIDRMDNYEDKGYNKIGFDSYEEACEEAIKYCLENLI